MSESLCLKTIYNLRVNASDDPFRYYIPAYQRGYRWTPTQVTQLLDDVREFTKRENPQQEEFYCLQPLVLRPNNDGAYEVVDGQQRLTTLLLILRHFNERLAVRYQQKLYRLEYETRPELDGFLENPSPEGAASNIDFFHIDQAIKTISEWFEKRDSEVEAIKDSFLNKTKIIWFQLSPGENAVAAFTRLNVGKIPLTNGELIRALFLKRGKGGSPGSLQLRIANEWDALEKSLQGVDFWSFLSNDTERRGSRIDFIFELVARQDGMRPGTDEYATFHHFSQKLTRNDADLEREWLTVKRTFMLLEEWFADRRLYHLVGYLIWAGGGCERTSRSGGRHQKAGVQEKAQDEDILVRVRDDGTSAAHQGMDCRPNLESANQASDLRTDIQAFIDLPAKEATDDAFDVVYEKVLRHFQEDGEDGADNGISNLVLLDYATNRSYGNAVFAVKRQRILSLDRDGVFVPLCTRNVFLKCYNPHVEHVMFWTQQDRDGYRQVMIDTLHAFFTSGWAHD